MKRIAFFLLALNAACSSPATKSFPQGRVVDLSYPYDEQTIFWPTAEPFKLERVADGVTDKGYYYAANNFCMAEHGGTHIDAPIHFHRDGKTVDRIPLEQLMGEGVVVDVADKCANDPDYQITVADIEVWEKQHGRLPNGAIVFLRTGYGKRWPDRRSYMGTDERGPEAVAKLHFPGLAPETARWLIANRSIKAIGLDTPSIDYGQSQLFEAHRTLFERNIPAFENLANLDQLPAKGFVVVALPIKIAGGSGGPLRAIAIIPD